ncbi:MAG: AAA family ATPase [Verrucomicrobiales bacterium]|nr:AAA family ATPase [Verrucomicrobiales bacterium]
MSKDDDIPPPPSPEEISRKLSEFMKASFGDAVSFSTITDDMPFPMDEMGEDDDEEPQEDPSERFKNIFEFDYFPRDIKAHLDRYVIRQEEAKKVLSIAVCDHYNHAKSFKRLEEDRPDKAKQIEFQKQNVIIVGPTGVGKTYLVKHIAELIGVPFVKADATKFSETGYVGADVDDLVRELVRKADGDVELAEYGIIYIDEVDKVATQGEMIGRDVSGRGVQTTLLKLMEETEVSLRNPNDIQSQMQAMFDRGGSGKGNKNTISTRHILFIVSGAFSGLEKIMKQRLRQGTIGFGAKKENTHLDANAFGEVETQDFIEFGFEAEFIGRLPVRVVCEHLEKGDLLEIMKSSEGSLIRQYEREFEAYGIKASFEEDALQLIAERAAKEKTGARGLMTVCERILRDFKFELPGSSLTEININRDLIDHPEQALSRFKAMDKGFSGSKIVSELNSFRRQFREAHGLDLAFEQDAMQALEELSEQRNMSVMKLCSDLFRDFQYGMKLVQNNTGQQVFKLSREAIEDPDGYLSTLVVDSYPERKQGKAEEVVAEDLPAGNDGEEE